MKLQRRTDSDYQFSQVPVATIPRSVFNRSHQYKTTFNAGLLIPFYVDEALPGDTFKCNVSIFARLGTPIVPLMDNIYLDVFFFAVPNRLVWSNWQRFCGEQLNPGDSTSFSVPQVNLVSGSGLLSDYFGIPLGGNSAGGTAFTVNALPFRAYNLIWNEWFRDENLSIRAPQPTGDGPDAQADYGLLTRGKRHDYFTSCLPWPQKGDNVNLPLGTSAPVVRVSSSSIPGLEALDSGGTTRVLTPQTNTAAPLTSPRTVEVTYPGGANMSGASIRWGVSSGLQADLSSATAATINSLRQAFQIQKLLERDARGGTRYVEVLKSHFGVTSPDFRLQRPEYLGGGCLPVVINPVAQHSGTGQTGQTTPQGNLAAFGTVGGTQLGFTKSFVEHTYIIGLISARADYSYSQGINRLWSRNTRYDFFWPALAHLGEQAVSQREIWADGSANDGIIFGYQERWAEYRYYPSMVTGLFRPSATGQIALWHLGQQFSTAPTLSNTFILENPPMSRVLAVSGAPHFLLDSYFQIQCARPMPVYSVPGLIDHF